MIKLYNTLTRTKEEFIPLEEGKVKMYVCGPTVYNYIHIGNARPFIMFDTLRRYLQYKGYDVTFVQNFTDVDDKIINKAISENTTEKVVAKMFEDAYWDSVERVGSSKPDLIPHATDYINEMIELIEDLIQKGYAYVSSGDVFFRVSKIKDYGCLSNQQIEELNSGARISVDDKKENPLDFALWKKTEVGIKWDSPFGSGRPGWHTECVVMNHKLFGDVIDIHGGGMDLKFPHHENEIAQAEAAYGSHLAKYWIHVGRLDLNGVKMSKSLGNVIYVKDIDNTHDGMVLRCLILFSPYRQMIPYSMDLFNQYAKEYDKWVRAYKQCLFELQYKGLLKDEVDPSLIDEFKKYMDDDFNVQNVLTLINNIVKVMNTSLRAKDYDTLALKLHTLEVILDVLHINLFVDKMTEEELAVYKEWQEARLNKDFEKADIARAKLVEWKLV